MSRFSKILLAALIALSLSCQRRPLEEESHAVYIDLEIDTEITNHQITSLPEIMQVLFFDAHSEQFVSTDFIGPEGGYVNVAPGDYHILVYNFGTNTTIIRNTNTFSGVEAYTNEISSYLRARLTGYFESLATMTQSSNTDTEEESRAPQDKIVYDPDHLFVARRQTENIPLRINDEVKVIEMQATTIVETWLVEVRNFKGLENVSSISCLITNQAEKSFIGLGERAESPVTIYFEVPQPSKTGVTINTQFNTFGKLRGRTSILSLVITDTAGGQYQYNYDVTDQFENNPAQKIIIDSGIDIPEPSVGGGGFLPSVGEWKDVITDIIL